MKSIENNTLLTKQLQTESIKIEKNTLFNYCGYYIAADQNDRLMPFAVVQNGNKIFRHFDDGYEDALVPISTTKFVIDDNSSRTIEFILNNKGEIAGLILSKQSGTYKMNKKK